MHVCVAQSSTDGCEVKLYMVYIGYLDAASPRCILHKSPHDDPRASTPS
jgi:hypothetical protein